MQEPVPVTIRTDEKTAKRLLNMVIREVHRIDNVVKKNGLKGDAADDVRTPMIDLISQFNLQGVE